MLLAYFRKVDDKDGVVNTLTLSKIHQAESHLSNHPCFQQVTVHEQETVALNRCEPEAAITQSFPC